MGVTNTQIPRNTGVTKTPDQIQAKNILKFNLNLLMKLKRIGTQGLPGTQNHTYMNPSTKNEAKIKRSRARKRKLKAN